MAGDSNGEDKAAGESSVASGCGCFLALVGLAVAFAIYKWAESGFPKFWQ